MAGQRSLIRAIRWVKRRCIFDAHPNNFHLGARLWRALPACTRRDTWKRKRARNESPGYFAARQHRFLRASFCRNGAFLFRVHRMWICGAGVCDAWRFLFLLRLHRYKPSMMDDRSTTADFACHGGNEEPARNTRLPLHARLPVQHS